MAEKPNMPELVAKTACRAEETPVTSDTTTKMFSGTRNNDESWKIED